MLLFVVALMIGDYITGVLAAWADGTVSSKIGFKRIPKKIMIMVMIGIGHIADETVGTDNMLMTAACFFYAANELISITENAIRMDVGVPAVFKKIIDLLKQKGGNDDDADKDDK